MNTIPLFQFFRYFIPGAISTLHFFLLVLASQEFSPQHELHKALSKFSATNGLGQGLLAIALVSVWGFVLHILYQALSECTQLDHRRVLFKLQEKNIIRMVPWDKPWKQDSLPEIKTSADLTRWGAWSIFDTEYYRQAQVESRKPDLLLRHEGMFDYFHGSGITIVGALAAYIIWCVFYSPLDNYLIACHGLTWIFLGFLIFNFMKLRNLSITHVESSFVELMLDAHALANPYASSSVSSRLDDLKLKEMRPHVIFVSEDHRLGCKPPPNRSKQ
jgi:hypothetical protein